MKNTSNESHNNDVNKNENKTKILRLPKKRK